MVFGEGRTCVGLLGTGRIFSGIREIYCRYIDKMLRRWKALNNEGMAIILASKRVSLLVKPLKHFHYITCIQNIVIEE